VATAECPVSFITPRSRELVEVFMRAKRLTESSGASMFGPDLSAWPAWAVDSFDVLERESIRYENARFQAEAPQT
jgi:hypothetical protein